MIGTPKRLCTSRITACAAKSWVYAGGMAWASRFHPMCPTSTPIARAFSATELRVGLLPCTANKLPSQHTRRSGRPNESSRSHRRLPPKHVRRANSAPPSVNAASRCTGKLVSNLRPRSTCRPNIVPRSITASASMWLAAPTTFSIQLIHPILESTSRVWAMSAGCIGSPLRPVEYGLHGGPAPIAKAPVSRTRRRSRSRSQPSPITNCSSPKRARYSGWSTLSTPEEVTPPRRIPSSAPPPPQKVLSTVGADFVNLLYTLVY